MILLKQKINVSKKYRINRNFSYNLETIKSILILLTQNRPETNLYTTEFINDLLKSINNPAITNKMLVNKFNISLTKIRKIRLLKINLEKEKELKLNIKIANENEKRIQLQQEKNLLKKEYRNFIVFFNFLKEKDRRFKLLQEEKKKTLLKKEYRDFIVLFNFLKEKDRRFKLLQEEKKKKLLKKEYRDFIVFFNFLKEKIKKTIENETNRLKEEKFKTDILQVFDFFLEVSQNSNSSVITKQDFEQILVDRKKKSENRKSKFKLEWDIELMGLQTDPYFKKIYESLILSKIEIGIVGKIIRSFIGSLIKENNKFIHYSTLTYLIIEDSKQIEGNYGLKVSKFIQELKIILEDSLKSKDNKINLYHSNIVILESLEKKKMEITNMILDLKKKKTDYSVFSKEKRKINDKIRDLTGKEFRDTFQKKLVLFLNVVMEGITGSLNGAFYFKKRIFKKTYLTEVTGWKKGSTQQFTEIWMFFSAIPENSIARVWWYLNKKPMICKPRDWIFLENQPAQGGYLINKKGINQLLVLKPKLKMEIQQWDKSFIENVNNIQKSKIILDFSGISVLIKYILEAFKKEWEMLKSLLKKIEFPNKMKLKLFEINYLAEADRSNQNIINAFTNKVSQVLQLLEMGWIHKNKNWEVEIYRVIQLCKSFRLHEKGVLSIAQCKTMRLLITGEKKERLSNYWKLIYTLRIIYKNPILNETEVNQWTYEKCRAYLKSQNISNLESDDFINFNYFLECFFPKEGPERYPFISLDATGSLFQILGFLAAMRKILFSSNVFFGDYSDIYSQIQKEIIWPNSFFWNKKEYKVTDDFKNWISQRAVVKSLIVSLIYGGTNKKIYDDWIGSIILVDSTIKQSPKIFFGLIKIIKQKLLFWFKDILDYIKKISDYLLIASKVLGEISFQIHGMTASCQYYKKKEFNIFLKSVKLFKDLDYTGKFKLDEYSGWDSKKVRGSLLTWIVHSIDSRIIISVNQEMHEFGIKIYTVHDCAINSGIHAKKIKESYLKYLKLYTSSFNWRDFFNKDKDEEIINYLTNQTKKKSDSKTLKKYKKLVMELDEMALGFQKKHQDLQNESDSDSFPENIMM